MTPLQEAVQKAEQEVILQTLAAVNFNKAKAAKVLGIDRKTLYNKLKRSNSKISEPTIEDIRKSVYKN